MIYYDGILGILYTCILYQNCDSGVLRNGYIDNINDSTGDRVDNNIPPVRHSDTQRRGMITCIYVPQWSTKRTFIYAYVYIGYEESVNDGIGTVG